ncbi:MAG TPA: Clr5 domain-containing protein, partial [Acidimicrobiales bacterium]|nr:Clr5 domain-containing protein [Acidimicrobiales bacterium]
MTTVVVPDKTKLRLYLQKGMTQKEIVDQWEEESGFRVSRSAIGMAIARYGLESANPRPRFDDLIPWTVRTVHKNRYDLRMLRLEHRRRHGKKLTDDQRKRLTSWRKALDAPQDG